MQLLSAVLFFMATAVFFWLICGFVAWEWNAGNWPESGRFSCVMAWLTVSGVFYTSMR